MKLRYNNFNKTIKNYFIDVISEMFLKKSIIILRLDLLNRIYLKTFDSIVKNKY